MGPSHVPISMAVLPRRLCLSCFSPGFEVGWRDLHLQDVLLRKCSRPLENKQGQVALSARSSLLNLSPAAPRALTVHLLIRMTGGATKKKC